KGDAKAATHDAQRSPQTRDEKREAGWTARFHAVSRPLANPRAPRGQTDRRRLPPGARAQQLRGDFSLYRQVRRVSRQRSPVAVAPISLQAKHRSKREAEWHC